MVHDKYEINSPPDRYEDKKEIHRTEWTSENFEKPKGINETSPNIHASDMQMMEMTAGSYEKQNGLFEPPKDVDKNTYEYITYLLNPYGRWNFYIFFLSSMGWFVWAYVALSYGFLGASTKYWCKVPELQNANWTEDQIKQFAIPLNDKDQHESCEMYNLDYTALAQKGFESAMEVYNSSASTIKCTSRVFDTSIITYSATIRWDMVCERRKLFSTTGAAVHFGMMTGAIFAGYFSDRFGRRPISLAFTVLYAFAGFLGAVVPWLELYTITRWLAATGAHGLSISLLVLSLEITTARQRPLVAVLLVLPWTVGYMLLPLFAYYIRNYQWLQFTITLPLIVLLPHFWILPESPRWLILNERHDEAIKVIKGAAKMNKRQLPADDDLRQICHNIYTKECKGMGPIDYSFWPTVRRGVGSLKRLVSHKKLVINLLLLFYIWIACSMTYYGVALNGNNLSSSVYIYVFLGGLIEVPGTFLKWPALLYLGRRWTNIIFFTLCGVALLIQVGVPDELVWLQVTLSLIGKICISPAFAVAYIHTAELFPTETRSFVIGLCSFVGRFGSIASPFITDLLGREFPKAPLIVYGTVPLVAVVATVFLPETKLSKMPDSVEEATSQDNKAFENTEITGTSKAS